MSNILFENEGIMCDKIDDFAVFYLKTDAYTFLSDMIERDEYHTFIKGVMGDDSIRGIGYIKDQNRFDDASFGEKFQAIHEGKGIGVRSAFEKIVNTVLVSSQLFLGCGKPTACGMVGMVGYDYFGYSMLFNYRCASNDTSFINTAYRFGVPPTAVLPYFLRHSIGQAKTSEVMLLKETLSADEAKELGIINNVVSPEDVLENCLNALEKMAKIPTNTFASVQSIVQPSVEDLEVYLDAAKKNIISNILNQ